VFLECLLSVADSGVLGLGGRLCGLSRTSHFDWSKLLPDVNFLALSGDAPPQSVEVEQKKKKQKRGGSRDGRDGNDGPDEEEAEPGLWARRAIGAILRGEDRRTLVRGLVRLGCKAIAEGAGDEGSRAQRYKFGFEEFVKAERAREKVKLRTKVVAVHQVSHSGKDDDDDDEAGREEDEEEEVDEIRDDHQGDGSQEQQRRESRSAVSSEESEEQHRHHRRGDIKREEIVVPPRSVVGAC
jgi:hypothetical protein